MDDTRRVELTVEPRSMRDARHALGDAGSIDLAVRFPAAVEAEALEALEGLLASPAMTRVTALEADAAHEGHDHEPEIRDYSDTMLESTRRTWHKRILLDAIATGRFRSLRRLSLRDNDLRADELEAILDQVPGLELLDVSENSFGDEGLRLLATSASLAGLKELRIASTTIGIEGARALATSINLAKLVALDCSLCTLESGAIELLLASPLGAVATLPHFLSSLTSTETLTRSEWLGRQEALDLSYAKLSADDLRRLVSSSAVAKLTSLTLNSVGQLGSEGAIAIAESPHLARLQSLALTLTNIGPDGARALVASPHLASLVELELDFNEIGDRGVHEMLAGWNLAGLRRLGLGSNGITDDGAKALAAAPQLAALESLNLHWNQIGDDGAVVLAATAITHLDLGSNAIGQRGQAALEHRHAPPGPSQPGEGHAGPVTGRDAAGGIIVTAGQDNTLRIWDAETGRQLRYVTMEHPKSIVQLTADGALVAALLWHPYKLPITVWDTATGKELYRVGASMHACAFSPDGALLCGGDSFGQVSLWDAKTGTHLADLGKHEWSYPTGAAFVEFSVDGRFVRSRGKRDDLIVHRVPSGEDGDQGEPVWPREGGLIQEAKAGLIGLVRRLLR